MASFNIRYLSSLLDQLSNKDLVLESLNAMAILAIPLNISIDLDVEAKLRPLIVSPPNRKPIRCILGKLEALKVAEEKEMKKARRLNAWKRTRARNVANVENSNKKEKKDKPDKKDRKDKKNKEEKLDKIDKVPKKNKIAKKD